MSVHTETGTEPEVETETAIKEVVLSGGGTNAIAFVGCLYALEKRGALVGVRRWVGSSAGALLAMFMTVGYTPASIYRLLMQLDYGKLNEANCDSVLSFFDTMGIVSGGRIMQLVRHALRKKGFREGTTFRELRTRTGMELVIAGYNLTQGKTVAFSAATTPEMSVMLACRISISVPFLFHPVVHDGDMYIDGCTIEHTPVRFSLRKESTLVVQCVRHPGGDGDGGKNGEKSTDTHHRPLPHDVTEFFALLQTRIRGVLLKKCIKRVVANHAHTVLSVPIVYGCADSFVVNFSMNMEDKHRVFTAGHTAALLFDLQTYRRMPDSEHPSKASKSLM
jgi:predicted acylesterase/phospholipase RssA